MHNIVFSKYFQSLDELRENAHSPSLIKWSFALNKLMKSASFAIFVDEIAVVFSLQQLVKANDVGTGL